MANANGERGKGKVERDGKKKKERKTGGEGQLLYLEGEPGITDSQIESMPNPVGLSFLISGRHCSFSFTSKKQSIPK